NLIFVEKSNSRLAFLNLFRSRNFAISRYLPGYNLLARIGPTGPNAGDWAFLRSDFLARSTATRSTAPTLFRRACPGISESSRIRPKTLRISRAEIGQAA